MKRTLYAWLLFLVLVSLLFISFAAYVTYRKEERAIVEQPSEPPIVLFCPADDCVGAIINLTKHAASVHCAFYEINIPALITALNAADASLVVDVNNYDPLLSGFRSIRLTIPNHQMHNKFCIINRSVVIMGSFNPTVRGAQGNDNNLVILTSPHIAANYEREFQELWSGVYGRGAKVSYPRVLINGNLVENYFCPEDCSPAIFTQLIDQAQDSVLFMTFSFTDDSIGSALFRARNRGVTVQGVFEKSQNSKWSEYQKLATAGIDVRLDTNPGAMHHKVFIIDRRIVITGSTNPSENGLSHNDENMLILHDGEIARQFMAEYERIWSLSSE